MLGFLPVVFLSLAYIVIFVLIIVYVVKTVNKSIKLKEEQNDLLRQLVFNTRKEEK